MADFASGAAHVALSYAALRFAQGERPGPEGTAAMAQPVMDFELGAFLIGLTGLGMLVAAAVQAKQAVTGSFMKHIAGTAPRVIEGMGRAGFAARGVVFAVIGYSLVRAAWHREGQGVKGLGEALLDLRDAGFLYALVAIGLLLFGAFSLVTSRYRILPDFGRGDLQASLHRAPF